jgi:hypothetical protein
LARGRHGIIVQNSPVILVDPSGLDSAQAALYAAIAAGEMAEAEAIAWAMGLTIAEAIAQAKIKDSGDDCREKECQEQLGRDMATCSAISRAEKMGKRPKGAASRCISTAMNRFGNCLRGIPQGDRGPLDTWNN